MTRATSRWKQDDTLNLKMRHINLNMRSGRRLCSCKWTLGSNGHSALVTGSNGHSNGFEYADLEVVVRRSADLLQGVQDDVHMCYVFRKILPGPGRYTLHVSVAPGSVASPMEEAGALPMEDTIIWNNRWCSRSEWNDHSKWSLQR